MANTVEFEIFSFSDNLNIFSISSRKRSASAASSLEYLTNRRRGNEANPVVKDDADESFLSFSKFKYFWAEIFACRLWAAIDKKAYF